MKQKFVVVDIESDGPLQGINSIVCFGAIIVEPTLTKTFYGQCRPISKVYNAEALAISGFTRKEHESFEEPKVVFERFDKWLRENIQGQPVLFSDNNGYDASWVNWYFHYFLNKNPFGWSSRRIGDLFCGFEKDLYYKWKQHRISKHTHDPVDDARGNAEALLYLLNKGLKL